MKNFLEISKLNSNFISLTGYKTLLIFYLLLNKPCSLEEIKEYFINDKNITNIGSDYSIRNYINSLRNIGCVISKPEINNDFKYELTSYPFEVNLKPSYLKALRKVFNAVKENDNIYDLENFESFIIKLISISKNEASKNYLYKFLIINKLDMKIYEQLKNCCQNDLTVSFIYKSPAGKEKEISMTCDKIFVKSGNVYIAGINLYFHNYCSLLIKRIKHIVNIKPNEKCFLNLENNIVYEIYDKNYIPQKDEEIINHENNKLTIKINNIDDFRVSQRILFMGDKCKVLYPKHFKEQIIYKLEEMSKIYAK